MAKIEAGSIYYYFDSKEAILDEVLDRGLRHVYETVKTAVKQAGTASHRVDPAAPDRLGASDRTGH